MILFVLKKNTNFEFLPDSNALNASEKYFLGSEIQNFPKAIVPFQSIRHNIHSLCYVQHRI